MKITMTIGDATLAATLLDTEAGRDFAAQLPLTLELSDYASTEKVSDLPQKLSIGDAPPGYKAAAGDITYYAPWGNLAIFYKDFSYAGGLVKLGQIDQGTEQLVKINGPFTAVFERAASE